MAAETFEYEVERFGEIGILRYRAGGFDELSLNQKKLIYFLSQAALAGRDINIDQNFKLNLPIRCLFEHLWLHSPLCQPRSDADEWTSDRAGFVLYTKSVWLANGIHHHYAMDKFQPEFSRAFLEAAIASVSVPLATKLRELVDDGSLFDAIFNPSTAAKRVCLDAGVDLIKTSACNMYGDQVEQPEVEAYYQAMQTAYSPAAPDGYPHPPSYGLNSRLDKDAATGQLTEHVYKVGGLYTAAIEQIVHWLDLAAEVSETEQQRKCIGLLVEFYRTGDLKLWDEFNIEWVKDVDHPIDFTNGFIEVYGDPLGLRGSYQGVVYMDNAELTKKFGVISNEAGWFERNSPIHDEYKREDACGVSYRMMTVLALSGDNSPTPPIGVNLPNQDWIRSVHGSKSVSLSNIEGAYDQVSRNTGPASEFNLPEGAELIRQHGEISGLLHTGLHEVIGHASGRLNPALTVTPKDALKNYASTLEEARADLVALYYIFDQHLIDIGLVDTLDVGRAEYQGYITNGMLSQLARIKKGANIEESHMRNRALIARWCFEEGREDNVIERKIVDGKTYFVVNDYEKLRTLFGRLLREVQRIKSEGDFAAGSKLVEDFGVQIDPALHDEVIERFRTLNRPRFYGFINPQIAPVNDPATNEIVDVQITFPTDFTQQMLHYATAYSTLGRSYQRDE